MNVQVEICVETSFFAEAAAKAGADRLEVCDRLDLDGLTPQPGVVESALGTTASVVVMLRDRADFLAGDDGATSLLEPLRKFASLGVQGVVFGFLQADGQLDLDSNRRLLDAAKEHDLDVVFHRAIDAASDPLSAAAQLNELHVDRVLSAGGAGTIDEGAVQFRRMRAEAPNLNWMPGGGVRGENVVQLLKSLQPTDIHSSARGDPTEVERLVGLCRSIR
ncbi:MAG TPA: copper homeostasis protein CutC [Phycisphaerales bacterium]|nr:copper homeostasis protein CutC [Phycisphaerales bacterium]